MGPFRIESDLEIQELRGVRGAGQRAVTLRLGTPPKTLENALMRGPVATIGASEFLMDIPNVARYYVADGREIVVEVAEGAAASDVSTFLLGSVFAALCYQNGLMPLHASAIANRGVAGTATAFLGDSGAGKSTLAAGLRQRGYAILSDDICLLEPGADGLRLVPVAGWLKLWRKSLVYFGDEITEANKTHTQDDKYRVYLESAAPLERPARLGTVVFLERAEDAQAAATLVPVSKTRTIAGLFSMAYNSGIAEWGGQSSRLVEQCAQVAGEAQGYLLTVPWDLERLPETIDLLERTLPGMAGNS